MLNWLSKLRDINERKKHPCHTKLCAFRCLISRPQILNQIRGKIFLSRKLSMPFLVLTVSSASSTMKLGPGVVLRDVAAEKKLNLGPIFPPRLCHSDSINTHKGQPYRGTIFVLYINTKAMNDLPFSSHRGWPGSYTRCLLSNRIGRKTGEVCSIALQIGGIQVVVWIMTLMGSPMVWMSYAEFTYSLVAFQIH